MLICSLCGRPVDPADRNVTPEVLGYEHKSPVPSRRSGSDIVLRRLTGNVAHDDCILRAKAGLSPLQEALV